MEDDIARCRPLFYELVRSILQVGGGAVENTSIDG